MNQHQRALAKARKTIESGKNTHVCIALLAEYHTRALREAISESLEGHATVKYWLLTQGIPRAQLTPEAMRKYRLRWIDKMIEDFA